MKDSEIYLRAAELVDRRKERYSCIALARVLKTRNPLVLTYCASMGFNGAVDFRLAHSHETYPNQAARQHRVLLLLLASAIAESEGR